MPREFSKNLNRLLKDSLTLEIIGFTGKIAVPKRAGDALAALFNSLFTMTGRGDGAARRRARRP
jgi:hypothetical protein